MVNYIPMYIDKLALAVYTKSINQSYGAVTWTRLQAGPGKAYRKGISLVEAAQKFGNDAEAERWLVAQQVAERTVACVQFAEALGVKVRKSTRQTPYVPAVCN